jgi:hypothetical protein
MKNLDMRPDSYVLNIEKASIEVVWNKLSKAAAARIAAANPTVDNQRSPGFRDRYFCGAAGGPASGGLPGVGTTMPGPSGISSTSVTPVT